MVKVVIPLGRIKNMTEEMVASYFDLPNDAFELRHERQFVYKYGDFIFLYVKPKDIMKMARLQSADYVFTSNDYYNDYKVKNPLDYIIEQKKVMGIQKLSLIGHESSKISDVTEIYTPYSNVAKDIFPEINVNEISSSLEIFPMLNKKSAIIDVVETGETMKHHNLKVFKTLFKLNVFALRSKNKIKI